MKILGFIALALFVNSSAAFALSAPTVLTTAGGATSTAVNELAKADADEMREQVKEDNKE